MKATASVTPVMFTRGLEKMYSGGPWWNRHASCKALAGIDLSIRAQRTLALIGESGSGKSTLALCLAALERPDAGEIWFEGANLVSLSKRELSERRNKIQLILQGSSDVLSPRFTAEQIIEEPLRIQSIGTKNEWPAMVADLLTRVGLSPDWKQRRAHQFSGGQRQRLLIARALGVRARLLILDEPFTGLDLSVQGQIANLLLDLQQEFGLTYVYLSHDLDMVRLFADDVAVMQQGRVVERASAIELFEQPEDPYTRTLLGTCSAGRGLACAMS